MSTKRVRNATPYRGLILVLLGVLGLAIPVGSSGQQLPGATVTVCQVTGSASAPTFAEVRVSVDQVAAYLNQYPGSFVGSCPASGGGASTSGGTGPVSGAVTVCRVTGSASAPEFAELTLEVDQVAAFLNRNPGSFVGSCPGQGGTVSQGPGRILGIPAGSAITICKVTATGGALEFLQMNVSIEKFAAFLNQNPGSFVGLCPGTGDPSGTVGEEPLGYVTVCRVTGDADNPLVPVTIRVSELALYLTRAGTVVPAPTSGCEPTTGGTETSEPSTTTPGETTTIVVQTTPNTVVTATGAGVNESAKSNKKGKATLKVTPKKKGIVTVRAAGNRTVKRVGVVSSRQSATSLTG